MSAHNFINLVGERFGRLLVLYREPNSASKRVKWRCQCDCGSRPVVARNELKSGETKSCGCLRQELVATNNTTHGLSESAEHKAWIAMRSWCGNPKAQHYALYGGRGIKVGSRWSDSFENFIKDMGLKPTEAYSIERINTNGNYTPKNCKWATDYEQAANRRKRKDNTSGCVGVNKHKDGGYMARLTRDGKGQYLGLFKYKKDAIKARRDAEKAYARKGN